MVPIISLLVVLTLSVLVTKIATVALTHTGLSRESARFQARSAFTGVGFTTNESETVVNHPVRRRILLILMLLGNAGIVTAISSLILTFLSPEQQASTLARLGLLGGGLTALWAAANSRWVDRRLQQAVTRALSRYTRLDVRDYVGLLHLSGEYAVSEMEVEEADWIAGKTLKETRLRHEGLLVLGVKRPDGTFIGAPDGDTALRAGDVLVLYGRTPVLEALDQRPRGRPGDQEHVQLVTRHRELVAREKEQDSAEEEPRGR